MTCATCESDKPCHCDALLGHAAGRGCRWAEEVIEQIGARRLAWRDWPVYGGKAAQIARRKTADLTRDRKTHEKLARRCHAEAERWYARRRRGV